MNNEVKADEVSASGEVWNLETRFLSILENTSDIIYACDIDGNLTFINKAAEKHTGYTSSELLKMNISELSLQSTCRMSQVSLSVVEFAFYIGRRYCPQRRETHSIGTEVLVWLTG